MEYLHKICEIYVTPPNDSKKVLEMLINTGFLVAECWDKDGRFKFEVFEKSTTELFFRRSGSMFKTIDQKIEDLDFRVVKNDKYGIVYKRWKDSDEEDVYEQTLAILHKKSGEHILQSYCPSLFDNKCIGNTCVGLTYNEMKLFTKKMKKLVRMWS